MRVVVLYKDQRDYTREVESYIADFKRFTSHDLETMDPESPEGISFSTTYDIMQFPAMIAISDDGQLQNLWLGLPLPTINEVSYYVR